MGEQTSCKAVCPRLKITLYLVGQVGVSIEHAFIQIDNNFRRLVLPVRLNNIGKGIIGVGKTVFGEIHPVAEIQPDIFTDGGESGRHKKTD